MARGREQRRHKWLAPHVCVSWVIGGVGPRYGGGDVPGHSLRTLTRQTHIQLPGTVSTCRPLNTHTHTHIHAHSIPSPSSHVSLHRSACGWRRPSVDRRLPISRHVAPLRIPLLALPLTSGARTCRHTNETQPDDRHQRGGGGGGCGWVRVADSWADGEGSAGWTWNCLDWIVCVSAWVGGWWGER